MTALREGRPDHGGRGYRHGRPIGQGGARKPTRTGLPRSSAASSRLSTTRARSRPTRRDLSAFPDGLVRETRLPSAGVKRGCSVAVERAGVRESGKPSSVMICRSRRSETIVVRKCFIGWPAESTLRLRPDQGRAGSQEAHHAARDRPSLLAHTLDRRCRVVGMPRQGGPKGPQGIENLSLEIVQDQPRTFRNGRRRQLIVKALLVAGPERRRGREALQQVVHRCDLLVERIRQGHCVRKGLLPKSPHAPRRRATEATLRPRCTQVPRRRRKPRPSSGGNGEGLAPRRSRALSRSSALPNGGTRRSNVNSQAGSEWWQKWVPRHAGVSSTISAGARAAHLKPRLPR